MKRLLRRLLVLLFIVSTFLFWLLYFSERPKLTIDPATLAGDGSLIDYCQLPELDGSGKMAVDIPKGNTPGCAYHHFPSPILSQCTEPLSESADDIRGLWRAASGKIGHVERVEQCGSRVVITAAGLIHDAGPNSSAGRTTDDTEGSVLFTIGDKEYCNRTSADMVWNNKVLDFHVFGWGPVVVRRYREGEQLVWEYADGSITQMNRICYLPENHRKPTHRGPRYKLW